MHLCPDCGNKRCPRASFHDNYCTGSNDPGQAGSDYVVLTPEQQMTARGRLESIIAAAVGVSGEGKDSTDE